MTWRKNFKNITKSTKYGENINWISSIFWKSPNWNFNLYENLFSSKDSTVMKMIRQAPDWEKIYTNHESKKGLESNNIYIYIYINSFKSIIRQRPKGNNMGKWSDYPFTSFTKERYMANKHLKRCSAVLVIRKMQIKTTMRYPTCPSDWLELNWPYQVLAKIWRNWDFHTLLVGTWNGVITLEDGLADS